MSKTFLLSIIVASLFALSPTKEVSTTSIVTMVGAVIKSRETPIVAKYKRASCPVCKGTGWYWSGDGIKKVDCGYCEE